MLQDFLVNVPTTAPVSGDPRSVKHLREKQVVFRITGTAWDVDLQVSYDGGDSFVDLASNVTASTEVSLVDGNGWPLLATHVRVVTNAGGVPGDPVAEPCVAMLWGYRDLG